MKKTGFTLFIIGLVLVFFYSHKAEKYSYLSSQVSWNESEKIPFVKGKKVSPSGEGFSFAVPSSASGWGKIKREVFTKVLSKEEKRLRSQLVKIRDEREKHKEEYDNLISSLSYIGEQIELYSKSEKVFTVGSRKHHPLLYNVSYFSSPASYSEKPFENIESMLKVKKQYKKSWGNLSGGINSPNNKMLILKIEHIFNAVLMNKPQTLVQKNMVFLKNGKKHVLSLVFPAGTKGGNALFEQISSSLISDNSSTALKQANETVFANTRVLLLLGCILCVTGVIFLFIKEKRCGTCA